MLMNIGVPGLILIVILVLIGGGVFLLNRLFKK